MEEIDNNFFTAGRLLIKKHLQRESDFGLEEFVELYAQALWLERREMDLMAAAIAKAFEGDKE